MNVFKVIVYYLISVFNLVFLMLSYHKLINSKFKINIKNVIVILLGSLVFTLNFYYSTPIYKIIINFLAVLASAIITSKEDFSISFYNVLICYLISFIIEIFTSSIVMFTSIGDMNTFNSNIILKALITVVDLVCLYLVCSIKGVIKIANKISNKAKNSKKIKAVVLFSVIVLFIAEFKFIITFSNKIYLSNIILLICLVVIVSFTLKSYLESESEKQKNNILLSFIKKYEKIVDENRAYKHELLNELLLLKNLNNKDSKEYDNVLDELIDKYTNKGIKIKNIYNLPTGLKGMFYYKLYGLDVKGYDVNINVSKIGFKYLKRIKYEDSVLLYRVLGIVLDNAIEAASNSKEKFILIDIYEDKNIIIEISNSFRGKIDLNKINEKNYSTKGKNKGLGLYILKNIIRDKNIEVNQSINKNIFNTKITINKK